MPTPAVVCSEMVSAASSYQSAGVFRLERDWPARCLEQPTSQPVQQAKDREPRASSIFRPPVWEADSRLFLLPRVPTPNVDCRRWLLVLSRALDATFRDIIDTHDGATYFAERVRGIDLR